MSLPLSLAHVVNPVMVGPESDLFIAQPVTLASLKKAKDFSMGPNVELFAICYPEDRKLVPDGFNLLPLLKRSILDIGSFKIPRKLPLLLDILDTLYNHTTAEYLIYTNVDIAVQPHFYEAIAWIIRQGYDAFVINRRTIDEKFNSLAHLPIMYSQLGESHSGHDCFIFSRKLYKYIFLEEVCIGVPGVGRALIWNLIGHATRFEEFTHLHLTFHIGKEKAWKSLSYKDYFDHNQRTILSIYEKINANKKLYLTLDKFYPHLLPRSK